MAILRRTEKAMMRAKCGVKLIEKKSQELLSLLGLKDILDGLARTSGVRWYGHVLRRDKGNVLRTAFDFEVEGKRARGRLNMKVNPANCVNADKTGFKKVDLSLSLVYLP